MKCYRCSGVENYVVGKIEREERKLGFLQSDSITSKAKVFAASLKTEKKNVMTASSARNILRSIGGDIK